MNPPNATFSLTGQEGENDGIDYVEFELLDADGDRVSLATSNIDYIKQDGTALTPNADETLWFNEAKSSGKYTYAIKTKAGEMYYAEIEWVKP